MLTANAGEEIGFLPISEWPLISLDLDVDLAWEGPEWTRDGALTLDRYSREQGILLKHSTISQSQTDGDLRMAENSFTERAFWLSPPYGLKGGSKVETAWNMRKLVHTVLSDLTMKSLFWFLQQRFMIYASKFYTLQLCIEDIGIKAGHLNDYSGDI